MDMSYLRSSGPLLVQHNRQKHVGVITDADLVDNRIRITAKVSQADQLSRDTWDKVTEGTLRHFSVGFRVFKAVQERSSRTITITDWAPLEASLAAAPDDIEAELGRSSGGAMVDVQFESIMSDTTTPVIDEAAIKAAVEAEQKRSAEAAAAERDRVAHVFAQSAKLGITDAARDLIVQRTATISEADEWLKVSTPAKADKQPAQIKERSAPTNRIPVIDFPDGTPGSGSRTPYNCATAVKVAHGYGSENEKGLAREITQDCVRAGMPEGVMDGDVVLPWTALVGPKVSQRDAADQIAGNTINSTDATGGITVDTDFMAAALIESLRPRAVSLQLGPRTMTGLRDNVEIPKKSKNTSVGWLAVETDPLTRTRVEYTQIEMTPKNVGAYSQFSNKLLMQSSLAIESLIRDDLMDSIALEQDKQFFYGSGAAGAPKGVNYYLTNAAEGNNANVKDLGPNDNTGAAMTADDFIEVRTRIFAADARGRMSVVTNPKVVGKMMNMFVGANASGVLEFSPVADDSDRAGLFRGYPVYQTNDIKSDVTKGTGTAKLSDMFAGIWSNVVIGYWGSGISFRRGFINDDLIRQQNTVTISTWLDFAVRHNEAFGKLSYIVT